MIAKYSNSSKDLATTRNGCRQSSYSIKLIYVHNRVPL